MDDYPGRRADVRPFVSRKGSAHVSRDTANNRDQNAELCNRVGCSGRSNFTKGAPVSCSGKSRSSRPSIRSSSNGKEVIGSSSRNFSAINNIRKSLPEPRKKFSAQPETDSSETGSLPGETEAPELIPCPGEIQRGLHLEPDDAVSSEITSVEVGSSSVASARSRQAFHQKSGLASSDTRVGSPVSLASKSTSRGARPNSNRYGLGNLRCNSISDVVQSGSSSSNSNFSRRKDTAKKRICDEENSLSARGKKMGGSSLEGRKPSSNSGISISDSRRARRRPSNIDNGAAIGRTQRSFSSYTRARIANQGSRNNLSPNESHLAIPQISQPGIAIDLNAPSSSHQFSVETSLSRQSSYSQPSTSSESLWGIRPSSPAEAGNPRLRNREAFRQYTMDGIAEVLFSLEGVEQDEVAIEQDDELAYEQLLMLETNFFLSGLNLYDQHRDMRLDIDNMSYEELLALEERMGSVSTALTEEALSDCLEPTVYQSEPLEDAATNLGGNKDDIKCSICQEEYIDGDEVVRLQCKHMYHVVCIHQWLRMKNWCPICKVAAAENSSSPLSSEVRE